MSKILKGKSFVISDNILAAGRGSMIFGDMLENFESPIQATVIDRLEAAGATLSGLVRPGDVVDMVAKGKASFGVGADHDGTIRKMASQNGLFGYKPTYGMVSRYGIVAVASSMDGISLVSNSAEQMETLVDIISGPDGQDSMLINKGLDSPVKPANDGRKVGKVKEFMTDDRDGKVSLGMAKYIMPMYHAIMTAEVSSNFMQYDSIRYGKRPSSAKTLDDIYAKSRGEGFDKKTKLNIMMGFHVSSPAMFETTFVQAAKARTMLIDEFNKLFEEYDFLVGSADSEIMAIAAALAGLPAVTMPNGKQVIGPMKSDKRLLDFAKGTK